MLSSFESLGLHEIFVQAIEKMGFGEPTPIQSAAIPLLLEGRDLIGQAQTGTGKTAAFMLPVLQRLASPTGQVRALILTPTRELAKQVAEATLQLGHGTHLKVLAVYGGQSYAIQAKALQRGVDVIVGTPGRLLDLIRQNMLDLSHVQTFVLDEADEMLAMGFIEDVELILKQVPAERHTAFFSATIPPVIQKLANRFLQTPAIITVVPEQITVAETDQSTVCVYEEEKLFALARLIETEELTSALIFARTKVRTQELADELNRMGYPADSLHGDLSQERREQVLNKFRKRQINLLVATDVAARGLDIAGVSHVFNYDLPADAEDYVHRIGRTGRAGNKGRAITFITPRERSRLKQIQSFTRQAIREFKLPSIDVVKTSREERLIQSISSQLLVGISPSERKLVEKMEGMGISTMEVAIGCLRMMRVNENGASMREIKDPDLARKAKGKVKSFLQDGGNKKTDFTRDSNDRYARERGMVKLWMNLGHTNGIRPGDIVGAIAGESGIPGRAIGEIDIRADHTFIDVAEQHVRSVLKAGENRYRLRGKPVLLRLAD